jgi:hypothetical protein
MSTDRDVTRTVRSWLDEGVTTLPDRVLDAVLDQVPATPQRRSWWPAWRFSDMNTYAKAAFAAAAVLVVAIVGYQFLPSNGGFGGLPTVAPTLAPTATPAPTAIPSLPTSGKIPAGTYRTGQNPTFLITVPEGWESSYGGVELSKHNGEAIGVEGVDEVGVDIFAGGLNVFTDACASEGTEKPVGPTVQDLLAALRAQQNSTMTEPVDVTIGGLQGKRVQIAAPAGLDVTKCSIGSLQIWERAGGGAWLAGMSQTHVATIYVADTPNGRLALYPYAASNASAADIAERDAIVASIRFE